MPAQLKSGPLTRDSTHSALLRDSGKEPMGFMRTHLASVVRTIPLAISTRIVHFLTAWLEFHISVLHIQMEILHVQTHSHLAAHNIEPGVTQPANCPWKILVCLTIMHATSYSDLCVGRIPCMHNFSHGTMTFPKPVCNRSRSTKSLKYFHQAMRLPASTFRDIILSLMFYH